MNFLDSYTWFSECFSVSYSSVSFLIISTVFLPWVFSLSQNVLSFNRPWPCCVLLNFLKAAFLKSGIIVCLGLFSLLRLLHVCMICRFLLVRWNEAQHSHSCYCLSSLLVIKCSAWPDKQAAFSGVRLPSRHLRVWKVPQYCYVPVLKFVIKKSIIMSLHLVRQL